MIVLNTCQLNVVLNSIPPEYLNHVQELTSVAIASCWQVECIMAILIYKNLMKGYFAHKSKVVVLSKQDPFPKLNGKPVNS